VFRTHFFILRLFEAIIENSEDGILVARVPDLQGCALNKKQEKNF
jgi:hypothetical protein